MGGATGGKFRERSEPRSELDPCVMRSNGQLVDDPLGKILVVEKVLAEAACGLGTEFSKSRLDLRELHDLSSGGRGLLRNRLRASLIDAPSTK